MNRPIDSAKMERWQQAQVGEIQFWLQLPEAEFERQTDGYVRLADQILAFYRTHVDSRGPARVLQIGCAVEDVVFHFPEGELYAVDPLADFYKSHFERSRNPRVDYRRAMGENVPLPDGFFNIVICQNVLDNCADYHVMLREIARLAADQHLLFFGTDVYPEAIARQRWDADLRGEIPDANHPQTFTETTLEATLADHGIEILQRSAPLESGKGDDSWRYCLFGRRRAGQPAARP